jgi:hypothetical protein
LVDIVNLFVIYCPIYLKKTTTDSILVELVDDQASTGALLTEKSYHNFAVLPDEANPTGGSGNLPVGFGQK